MIDIAYAQNAPAAGTGAESPIAGFLPLILIFAVFYFLLIRPQRKQMREQQKMINSLKKNDMIVTSGGIHGRITALKGKQLEVEIAPNVRVTINRPSVTSLAVPEEDKGQVMEDNGQKKLEE